MHFFSDQSRRVGGTSVEITTGGTEKDWRSRKHLFRKTGLYCTCNAFLHLPGRFLIAKHGSKKAEGLVVVCVVAVVVVVVSKT